MTDPSRDILHQLAWLVAGNCDPPESCGVEISSISTADLPELVRLAQRHGLGPLLLANAQRLPTLPDELAAPLHTERAEVAVHYMLATQLRRKIDEVFASVGVRSMWLKGIVLAGSAYSSPELRPMVDVDVLVPYSQRERALAAVEEIGYLLQKPQLFDGRDGLKHHYYLESVAEQPVSLELHFRLLGALDRLLSLEDQLWFWTNVEDLKLAGSDELTAPRPEAHLLYLCAHAILQHGEADLRLLRFFDLDRIVATTPGFDWDLVIQGAVRLRWTYAVQRALALAQDYFRTPLPSGLMTELSANRPKSESAQRALRRQWRRTTTQTVMDDLAAMNWADRFRSASRIVLPPPSYMRWRYGLESDRGLPMAYLRRMRRIGSDVLISIRRKGQTSQ